MAIIKTLTILTRRELQIAPIPQWRYYLNSSSVILKHIISANMSALPHSQVGDKQVWNDNRDYRIFEYPTHVNIYVLLGEEWWNVGRTQQVLLYSSVDKDIAHIAGQLQHNDRFSNCVLLYWLYKLYCSDGWGKCTKAMTANTQFALKWCCNVTICWTMQCVVQRQIAVLLFANKLLDTERCVTSILWRWRNQLSATVQDSLYTHSFM